MTSLIFKYVFSLLFAGLMIFIPLKATAQIDVSTGLFLDFGIIDTDYSNYNDLNQNFTPGLSSSLKIGLEFQISIYKGLYISLGAGIENEVYRSKVESDLYGLHMARSGAVSPIFPLLLGYKFELGKRGSHYLDGNVGILLKVQSKLKGESAYVGEVYADYNYQYIAQFLYPDDPLWPKRFSLAYGRQLNFYKIRDKELPAYFEVGVYYLFYSINSNFGSNTFLFNQVAPELSEQYGFGDHGGDNYGLILGYFVFF